MKISISNNKVGWKVSPIDSQRHLTVTKLFSLKSKSNPAVKSVTATTAGVIGSGAVYLHRQVIALAKMATSAHKEKTVLLV